MPSWVALDARLPPKTVAMSCARASVGVKVSPEIERKVASTAAAS